MEFEEDIVRFQVCEKCHEHDKVDPHSELEFYQAFVQCQKQFQTQNLKLLKNVPFKFMLKAPDTRTSTKRYLDQNTQKVHDFPRTGAFQVYYLNILVFSKLQQGSFPNHCLLRLLITKLRNYYQVNPLLTGLERFRDLEIEWKKSQKMLQPFYTYVKSCFPDGPTDKDLDKLFKRINKNRLEKGKKKVIYPYSFYANREKNTKMERIYCPTPKRSVIRCESYKNVASKISSMYKNHRPPSETLTKQFLNKKELPDMVKCRSRPKQNIKTEDIKSHDQMNQKDKNMCSSYIDELKKSINSHKNFFDICSQKKNINESTFPFSNSNQLANPSQFMNPNKFLNPNQSTKSTQRLKNINENNKRSSQMINKCTQRASNHTMRIPNSVISRGSESEGEKKSFRKNFLKSGSLARESSSNFSKKGQEKKINEKDLKGNVKNQVSKIIDDFKFRDSLEKTLLENKKSIQAKRLSNIKQQGKQFVFQQWQIEKIAHQAPYQPANILHKFTEHKNFDIQVFKNEYLKVRPLQTEFTLDGSELYQEYQICSIRKLKKPKQFKLFPDIIQQISYHMSHALNYVVNMLLKQNPYLITRIFQNKKFVNPFGNYCIWLKSRKGIFEPVMVNDQFAFDVNLNPIYAKMGNQNSIWFMLLEKAIAKMLGSYQKLQECTYGQMVIMILGCPRVEFKNLSPQKIIKILNQKMFYNRLAYFYILLDSKDSHSFLTKQIERITSFTPDQSKIKQSQLVIQKNSHEKQQVSMNDFLLTYSQIYLLFFNSNFYFNQSQIPSCEHSKLITLVITSKSSSNDCYLLFNNFPKGRNTKVTIYKKLCQQNFRANQGMKILEQQKKYEYVGEIEKTDNFFFQTQLQVGEYICLLESFYNEQKNLGIFTYSEKQLYIQEVKIHDETISEKKQNNSCFYLKKKKIDKADQEGKKQVQTEAPRILVERSLCQSEIKQKIISQRCKSNEFRIRKKFIVEDDCESENNGANDRHSN